MVNFLFDARSGLPVRAHSGIVLELMQFRGVVSLAMTNHQSVLGGFVAIPSGSCRRFSLGSRTGLYCDLPEIRAGQAAIRVIGEQILRAQLFADLGKSLFDL